jgi:S1-C subfamily serine protease
MQRGGTLALAIPSSGALRFMNDRQGAAVEVGITVRPIRIPGQEAMAFLILETRPGFPADHASLLIGDLLVGANGRRFQSLGDLEDAIETARGALQIQFHRGGIRQDRTVTIRLGHREAAA